MKKVAKFGILALILVSLVASAFAFSGRGFGNEAAKEALESGDYASRKNAMIAELTEERFDQMAERYGQMAEKRAAMQEANEKIQQALENGDYTAWEEAVSTSGRTSRIAEIITEDNFDTYVKLHQAMQDKDLETAKELSEELGLENPEGRKGFSRGKFRHFKGQFRCGMVSE